MSFKNLPTLLSLTAGLLVCIVTFIYQYEGLTWLWLVLGALLLFYGLGLCLNKLFSVVLVEPKDEDEDTDEDSDGEERQEDSPKENDSDGNIP
ncbi:MAG: hypothetical protein ACI4AQ_07825 [Lachnospiraceae bacterium]